MKTYTQITIEKVYVSTLPDDIELDPKIAQELAKRMDDYISRRMLGLFGVCRYPWPQSSWLVAREPRRKGPFICMGE